MFLTYKLYASSISCLVKMVFETSLNYEGMEDCYFLMFQLLFLTWVLYVIQAKFRTTFHFSLVRYDFDPTPRWLSAIHVSA